MWRELGLARHLHLCATRHKRHPNCHHNRTPRNGSVNNTTSASAEREVREGANSASRLVRPFQAIRALYSIGRADSEEGPQWKLYVIDFRIGRLTNHRTTGQSTRFQEQDSLGKCDVIWAAAMHEHGDRRADVVGTHPKLTRCSRLFVHECSLMWVQLEDDLR